jgi:hypothetical protein
MDAMSNPPQALNAVVGIHVVAALCLFISSCTVSGNTNAGFNVLITAMVNFGFCGACFYMLKNPSQMNIGILLGSSALLCLMNLENAIYWGQLSGCKEHESGEDDRYQFSCINTSGMKAVSAFGAISFVIEVALFALLVNNKDSIATDGGQGYGNLDGYGGAPRGSAQGYGQQDTRPAVADL